MQRLLDLHYQDRPRAEREIADLSRHLLPGAGDQLERLLVGSPAPERALQYFVRLRERQPAAFGRAIASPPSLRYLVAVFTQSHFLSEDLLDHPDWAAEFGRVHRVVSADELRRELEDLLPSSLPQPLELAKFRRRHILRILVRDVLGFGTLPEICTELSELADVILETAYGRIYRDLVERYGAPREETGGGEAHFAVIALGKLGGMELNYSSDIDLMFLYSCAGHTDGSDSITNKEFFKIAANRLTDLLSTYTPEGMCYRVDLRLRPDGSLGEACISLDGARQYYQHRARDWELQMLIKARVAAGHRPTGRALLDFVEPRIYSSTLDFSAVEQLSLTRERLNEKLAERQRKRGIHTKIRDRGNAIDVKLERGGIRDIEFVVQCLQRLYGGAQPWVRQGGTLLALARLQDKGFLSGAEYGRLASAYQFLRHLEHRLQFDNDLQTHALPQDSEALELLARRMPGGGANSHSAERLMLELHTHFEQVREIYERVVHSRRDTGRGAPEPSSRVGARPGHVVRALDQRAPALAAELARAHLRRGFQPFEHFLDRLSSDPGRLDLLNAYPELAARTMDLFEHSPYFAEEFIRMPELVDDVLRSSIPLIEDEPAPREMTALRRWFRREMVRIQAESVCRGQPIFETLHRTSELADATIARAYDIAIAETLAAHPPQNPAYEASGQMWVIALGRLGMRELDLASDADLVFVLSDADAAELEFWTRVAERLVERITAYTGSGVLFAVDTRLRPNGSSGALVQTESVVKEYFSHAAEAWEGITYMKSLVVGGEPARAQKFLHELQELDWKRYGQGGRSRSDLRQMRMRLEKEQGPSHPLKAGRGGYYDIDFLLMYLRLKSAGVFFRVLNTPARIEVLENMGELDASTSKFLLEAATFYRALDHGLRIISGHVEGKLPRAEVQREMLAALLQRWTPVPLSELNEIRGRTREAFDRHFR
ncbi:MAG TPA: glutamine-synthetase adenylyltransferase [Bryobacteraceae bacterium]|jgi:glutamate-ammonia-ligase adenylyltransferase